MRGWLWVKVYCSKVAGSGWVTPSTPSGAPTRRGRGADRLEIYTWDASDEEVESESACSTLARTVREWEDDDPHLQPPKKRSMTDRITEEVI